MNIPKIIIPKIYKDDRGKFFEIYKNNLDCTFVQDNISYSKKNVLRGLHIQYPHLQDKLITVLDGVIIDVVVNPITRIYSKIELNSIDHKQLFLPRGLLHGFYVLSDTAIILYKCSEMYYPNEQHSIAWNDGLLNIDWGTTNPVLSDNDKNGISLKEFLDILKKSNYNKSIYLGDFE